MNNQEQGELKKDDVSMLTDWVKDSAVQIKP